MGKRIDPAPTGLESRRRGTRRNEPRPAGIPLPPAQDPGKFNRRLGSIDASDNLSVVQECFVGAFLLLLMFMVYLFTRRVTAPKTFGPIGTRIVRKKAPTFMRKLL